MENIIDLLNWRYAVKRMTGERVSEEKINTIVRAAHLAPSGIGLQPYELIVINNPDIKKQIQPIALNQATIVESSHLIVFAVWDEYSTERIDQVFDHLISKRNSEFASEEKQRNFAKQFFGSISIEENFHHAAKQANIALGLSIIAAASVGVDATPMEGFDAAALDNFLDLHSKGLRSSMLMAVGYRDKQNDWNLKNKKVRKPIEKFVTFL